MPYAIDLGNTTLKVLHQNPQSKTIIREHHWVLAKTDMPTLVERLLHWRTTLPVTEKVAWLSTNPTVEAELFQYLATTQHPASTWLIPLDKQTLLNAETNGGVDFTEYQASWETIGIDRVLNVLQFARTYPTETGVVINAGTCTTVDLLISGKTHGGGAIIPGFSSWLGALPATAPHLPLPLTLALTQGFKPPTSTQEAVTQGVGYPYALGILAYTQQLATYWQLPLSILVLTGGYSAVLAPCLQASLAVTATEQKTRLNVNQQWAEQAIFDAFRGFF